MSKQPAKSLPSGPVPSGPVTDQHDAAIAARAQAEHNEVAGRHKNDGQMPHKGAR